MRHRDLTLVTLGGLFAANLALACGSEPDSLLRPFDGGGTVPTFGDAGTSDASRGLGDGACGPNLTGTLRDFNDTHPDFENKNIEDLGIVLPTLGTDFKPVYASASDTPSTSGKANFDQWYRDVPGVNVSVPYTLVLTPLGNGISSFENNDFFPLDGKGHGNQGREHNFHFTFELHTEFSYSGGEVFTFIGDDDVFVFINGKLAIDLGGVHGALNASVDLDQKAAELGIEKGKTYGLSVFQAERHTSKSQFRIDTSIKFTNCNPIIR